MTGRSGRARWPVVVGWSTVSRFEGEPLDAWAAALGATGVPPRAIDSLDVVYCQSWPYDDPAGRLAAEAGASPRRAAYSGIGGTTPLVLVAEAAERIMAGEADVCAVVGGEQLATVRRLKKEGARPQWSHRDPVKRPFPFEAPFHPAEVTHSVFQAYTTFALRDTARRARTGAGVEEHRRAMGELFAPMTEVAAANRHAWFPARRSAAELVEPGPSNRVVAHPYTKLVTAIMDVDLCGAVVVAAEETADLLGVEADRRIYVRGWGHHRDPDYVAEHPDLWRAPAMASALHGALARSGSGVDDVARFDLYSCFPSSVWFSLDALGLSASDGRAPFTVTGGLPYAGGPGSCYTLLSTSSMCDALAADPGSVGLVTGVGMHLSKHAALVLSADPGAGPGLDPLPPVDGRRVPIVEEARGPATVAAYTVHHSPGGEPSDGVIVADLPGGARTYGRVEDPGLLSAMEAEEWVGRAVSLGPGPAGVNLVSARPH